jgi:DNA polymerase-3 subunit beta
MAKLDNFKLAAKAADAKSTIPVLQQVFVSGGFARATDLDLEVIAPTYKANGAYNKRGEPLANAVPASDYQTLRTPGLAAAIACPIGDIAADLRKVESAIPTEETRYYLNGVFMEFQKGLKLTATDGHRLLHYTARGVHSIPLDIDSFILPREAAKLIASIKGGDWTVKRHEYRVEFHDTVSGVTIISKMIDGSYPDYNRVIPKGPFNNVLRGEVKPCLDIISQCAKYGAERSKSVKMTGETLEMRPADLAPLSISWPVKVDSTDYGRAIQIGFNAMYLKQMLEACGKAGEFALNLSDESSPARFDFPTVPGLVGVCMPLRV